MKEFQGTLVRRSNGQPALIRQQDQQGVPTGKVLICCLDGQYNPILDDDGQPKRVVCSVDKLETFGFQD